MNIGIIFDMDGTLWDSAIPVAESWNVILKKHGYNIVLSAEDIMKQMGKMMNDVADGVLYDIPKDKRYDILQECMVYENEYLAKHGATVYDGVEEVFKQLSESGYKVCIVSNCQKGYIETFLDYYKLWDYVTDIEDAGKTGLPKDRNIALVIERNHFDHAFYVGDIEADMIASDKGGSEFIHAKYGFGSVDDGRPYIEDIKDLPYLVDRLIND